MLRQSIESPDPVIFFEPKRRYYTRGEVSETPELGLHEARIVRTGADATLLCFGPLVETCLDEELYYVMEAPVLRVTGWSTPYPPAKAEGEHIPDVDRILDAVDRSLAY